MESPVKDSKQLHEEAATIRNSTVINTQESSKEEGDVAVSKMNPLSTVSMTETLSRLQKRKVLKKAKRKQRRQQAAEEAKLHVNDVSPEQEDEEAVEKERLEHELQLKLWLEREKDAQEEAERKRKEEEERKKMEDEEWEYVEDGPSEIIWEGNEIIVRKKKVKVRKDAAVQSLHANNKNNLLLSNPSPPTDTCKEHDRPVSNPLPPQSVAFRDQKKLPHSTVQVSIEQTPNFGTEQDKTHCPFHIKTGVCRFGVNCSRIHVYPDTSCTILIKNMYNGPGLPLEYDEGLEVVSFDHNFRNMLRSPRMEVRQVNLGRAEAETITVYTDEEIAQYYEEFYEDVHGEFLRYGEVVNFKVCRNESAHLRGNVYVHFQSVDSAVSAYNALNGRFYAGKQITCEFVAVTRWRVALCGEYMRSHHKACSHGTACNFLHCFRNPHGEYDWADWDNPRPKTLHQRRRRCNTEEDNEYRNKDDQRHHRHSSREKYRSRSHRSNHERERRYGYSECDENSRVTHRRSSSRRKEHQNNEQLYEYTDSDENSSEKKKTHRRSSSKRKHLNRGRRYRYIDSNENSSEEKITHQRSSTKRKRDQSQHRERELRDEYCHNVEDKTRSDQSRRHHEREKRYEYGDTDEDSREENSSAGRKKNHHARWNGNDGSDDDFYEDNKSVGMSESKSEKNHRDHHKSNKTSAWDLTSDRDRDDINERQKSKNKEKCGHTDDRNNHKSFREHRDNSKKSKGYRKMSDELSTKSPSRTVA